MKTMIRNRKAFSVEAILLFLMVTVLFSWITFLVSKAAIVQGEQQNGALAQVHAEYVITQLKNIQHDKLFEEIQNGTWNFPNAPSVSALGLGVLPNETILTESIGTSPLQVKISVGWQNMAGNYQEKHVELTID